MHFEVTINDNGFVAKAQIPELFSYRQHELVGKRLGTIFLARRVALNDKLYIFRLIFYFSKARRRMSVALEFQMTG